MRDVERRCETLRGGAGSWVEVLLYAQLPPVPSPAAQPYEPILESPSLAACDGNYTLTASIPVKARMGIPFDGNYTVNDGLHGTLLMAEEQYNSVLVCITALFTHQSSAHSEPPVVSRVVGAVQGWKVPTVKLVVITQDDLAVRALSAELRRQGLYKWVSPSRQLNVSAPKVRAHPLNLACHHRTVMETELGFSLYAYLEHDIAMRWEQVVAWARDEELFRDAPPSAQGVPWVRGFYRWYTRYTRPGAPSRASSSRGGEDTEAPATLNWKGDGAAKAKAHTLHAERFLADGNPCHDHHGLSTKRCRVTFEGGRTFVGLPVYVTIRAPYERPAP